MKQKKRKVLILFTGGTLGMVSTEGKKGRPLLNVSPKSPAELKLWFLSRVPELRDVADCEVEILLNRDSAHMGPSEWLLMADRIQKAFRTHDGVVVLHGTDTLSYTASALSFLLRPCKKPVVITGAQKPLSALRSDAKRNLLTAVEIAAGAGASHHPASTHDPRVSQGVTVFFDHLLLQGNRARKRSPSEFFAFDSPKFPPLAEVGTEVSYLLPENEKLKKASGSSLKLQSAFSENIIHLHLTPSFPARRVSELLETSIDGILLTIYPSGTGPTHLNGLLEFLERARKKEIPVVLVAEGASVQENGGANPNSYAAGKPLIDHGGIWAGEMTPECAYVKMAWILAQKEGASHFQKYWNTSFAHEGGPTE